MRELTPQQLEERRAREQHRNLERARREGARKREQAWRAQLADEARRTRHAYPRCHCDFRGIRNLAQLKAMGGGCTMPAFACGRWATVLREMTP